MTFWEYRTEWYSDLRQFTEDANRLGLERWELVQVEKGRLGINAYFKRPKSM